MYKNLYDNLLEKIFIENPSIKKTHCEVFHILNSPQLIKPEKIECLLSLNEKFVSFDNYSLVIYNDSFDYHVNHLAKKVFMKKMIGNISVEITDDLLTLNQDGNEFNYFYDSKIGANYFQSSSAFFQLENNSLKFFIDNSEFFSEAELLDIIRLNYDVDLNKSESFQTIKIPLLISIDYIDNILNTRKILFKPTKSTI